MKISKHLKPLKYVVITRDHPSVNFGQIVKFAGYNDLTQQTYIIPEGEKYEIAIDSAQIIPCEWFCDPSKINAYMQAISD